MVFICICYGLLILLLCLFFLFFVFKMVNNVFIFDWLLFEELFLLFLYILIRLYVLVLLYLVLLYNFVVDGLRFFFKESMLYWKGI